MGHRGVLLPRDSASVCWWSSIRFWKDEVEKQWWTVWREEEYKGQGELYQQGDDGGWGSILLRKGVMCGYLEQIGEGNESEEGETRWEVASLASMTFLRDDIRLIFPGKCMCILLHEGGQRRGEWK